MRCLPTLSRSWRPRRSTAALHCVPRWSCRASALLWAPQLEGFVVSGLGTEDWAQAQSQCNQSLPARYRDAAVGPSSLLARAVLAAEDQRFYQHPGYDLREMTQALHHNQQEDATLRGASTLSQQVAKLLVTGGERSPVRKLRELLYAVEMEQTLGKARILRLYLNQAPWGATVCGAQAAAYTYFGKSANSAQRRRSRVAGRHAAQPSAGSAPLASPWQHQPRAGPVGRQ